MNNIPPEAQNLIQSHNAGWANAPPSGFVGGVVIPAGAGSILVGRGTGCIILTADGKPIIRSEKVSFQRAERIDIGRFRAHLTKFEGNISFMYLDSKGNVTVGLGHKLDDAAEAMKFDFHDRKSKTSSHPVHIENAFNRVLNSPRKGEPAENFKNETHIDLSRRAIELLFDADVREFLPQLKARANFSDFETYPASAQLAMLDMAYTLGTFGFKNDYRLFGKALDIRNWIEVANQSGRKVALDAQGNPGKMADRNRVVKDWFLEAIKDEPFFVNPVCLPKRI